MEFLMPIAILTSTAALVVIHCWSVSALFSYRFGVLRGLGWFFPIVLLPLIGPLIFFFSTRHFRELNRPTRTRAVNCFIAVITLFMAVVMYISIEQFNHFKRRSADADATGDMTRARSIIWEHIEKTGTSPVNLKELEFAPGKPEIHIIYKKDGEDGFELKGWHDKGEREMKMSHKNNEIERMLKNNP